MDTLQWPHITYFMSSPGSETSGILSNGISGSNLALISSFFFMKFSMKSTATTLCASAAMMLVKRLQHVTVRLRLRSSTSCHDSHDVQRTLLQHNTDLSKNVNNDAKMCLLTHPIPAPSSITSLPLTSGSSERISGISFSPRRSASVSSIISTVLARRE